MPLKKLIENLTYKKSEKDDAKLFLYLLNVTGLPERDVSYFISLASENEETFQDYILAITAVMLGIATADGDFSEKEQQQIFVPFFEALLYHSYIENLDFIATKFVAHPNIDICVEYIHKIDSSIDLILFDKIIEHIARADDLYCVDEKNFIDSFRHKTGRLKVIPVVATMSSGKSTLINSLLNTELLPSENQACTATVFKIENFPYAYQPYYRYLDCEQGITDWSHASFDKLQKANRRNTLEVEIITNFLSSVKKEKTFFGSITELLSHNDEIQKSKIYTVFYDTPGPNNSTDSSHAQITESILAKGNFGQIIVVLNAEQFGIDDEYDFLEKLLSLQGKCPSLEFAFVINKFDSLDPEKENINKFYYNVKDHLEEIGFSNPIIVPAMCKLALQIRTALYHPNIFDSWSNRKKNALSNDLEDIFSAKEKYIELFSSDTMLHMAMNFLEKYLASQKSTKIITIGKKDYSINDLTYLSFFTGIPLLEIILATKVPN